MGGIEIVKPGWEGWPQDQDGCGLCRRPIGEDKYAYYCEEEEAWIHRGCIHEFLLTESRGLDVLRNKYKIRILEEGEG